MYADVSISLLGTLRGRRDMKQREWTAPRAVNKTAEAVAVVRVISVVDAVAAAVVVVVAVDATHTVSDDLGRVGYYV